MKYLLSHASITDEKVMQLADAAGIDPIPGGSAYITHLRDNRTFPLNYDPMNKDHRPSMDFLQSEGIFEMWFPTDATLEAVEFASTPQTREIICALIAADAPLDKSCQWLLEHLCVETSVETLKEFRHYFWNVKLLSTADMAALQSSGECSPLVGTAASLYKGELGPQTLMWKFGHLPTKISRDDAINSIRNISLFNSLEVDRTMPQGTRKAAALRTYSEVFFKAQAMMDESEKPDTDVLSDFYRNITVGHVDFNPPTVDKLGIGQEQKCEKTDEDTGNDS